MTISKDNDDIDGTNDHPVFEVIKTSKPEDVIEAVRNYFEVDGVSVEILDGSGMTPLMHACWKGNLEFSKFLIKQVVQKSFWINIISCQELILNRELT